MTEPEDDAPRSVTGWDAARRVADAEWEVEARLEDLGAAQAELHDAEHDARTVAEGLAGVLPPEHRPQVLAARCNTCVLRPGNRMHLAEGRLADLVRSNLEAGTLLTCHHTLDYGDHPEVGPSLCRGFFDQYADRTALGQIMPRLFGPDWWREVPVPEGMREVE